MGRTNPQESWRERLLWTSLSACLVTLMLLALVAWVEWIEAGARLPSVVDGAPPISGAVVADLLAPPLHANPEPLSRTALHSARLSPVVAVRVGAHGDTGRK